jgi:hypothetical protein
VDEPIGPVGIVNRHSGYPLSLSMRYVRVLTTLVLLPVLGCTSGSTSSSADAATDVVDSDAPSDTQSDGLNDTRASSDLESAETSLESADTSPADILNDASGELPTTDSIPCPTVETVCQTLHCVENWSAAQNPAAWCEPDGGSTYAGLFSNITIHPNCNGFNIVALGGSDVGMFFLYSINSGLLEAVGTAPFWSCVGGVLPAPFSLECAQESSVPLCR